MTYMSGSENVRITVEISRAENGTLTKTVTYADGDGDNKDTITNTYEKPVGSVTIPVKKVITGNEYSGSETFTITLEAGSAKDAKSQRCRHWRRQA